VSGDGDEAPDVTNTGRSTGEFGDNERALAPRDLYVMDCSTVLPDSESHSGVVGRLSVDSDVADSAVFVTCPGD
jgi:hypothetical protein